MLPLFHTDQFTSDSDTLVLDEETSRHIVQVLRLKKNARLHLTDGKGNEYTASIVDDHKKRVMVKIEERNFFPQDKRKITVAISLLKNANRFEWFLEKATEIGISEIIPMLCERTERQHFRLERMQNILLSAMLQSRQCWMPHLGEPVKFKEVASSSDHQQKFVAHCIDKEMGKLPNLIDTSMLSQIILIGPEGDFTPGEVSLALGAGFIPVTLGENRLRAETAGVVAATLIKLAV